MVDGHSIEISKLNGGEQRGGAQKLARMPHTLSGTALVDPFVELGPGGPSLMVAMLAC